MRKTVRALLTKTALSIDTADRPTYDLGALETVASRNNGDRLLATGNIRINDAPLAPAKRTQ
jgi:hypothetical protein